MTTKHSTCVFCDGGDGLMVERRDDGLFIYAVPPFLRYVSQNLIFAILTRIFEVFQDAANDADACFPSSTKTWLVVCRLLVSRLRLRGAGFSPPERTQHHPEPVASYTIGITQPFPVFPLSPP